MEMLAFVWYEVQAAQQRLRNTLIESGLLVGQLTPNLQIRFGKRYCALFYPPSQMESQRESNASGGKLASQFPRALCLRKC
jgi:hypothetical protein